MESQKKNQIRSYEAAIECVAFCIARVRASAARKHHEEAVILAAIVPRAPGEIKSENPWKHAQPEMRQGQRQQNHGRRVDREDSIFLKIFLTMVGPVNRGHVVRIVEQEC